MAGLHFFVGGKKKKEKESQLALSKIHVVATNGITSFAVGLVSWEWKHLLSMVNRSRHELLLWSLPHNSCVTKMCSVYQCTQKASEYQPHKVSLHGFYYHTLQLFQETETKESYFWGGTQLSAGFFPGCVVQWGHFLIGHESRSDPQRSSGLSPCALCAHMRN